MTGPVDTGQYGVTTSSPGVPSVTVQAAPRPSVTVSTAGPPGPAGPAGPAGPTGPAGPGVPTGGTTNQVLAKIDATNYHTQWVNQSGGNYFAPTSLVTVTGSVTATANAVHVVNISADTTITLPVNPPAGTVCEFLRTDAATNTCSIAAGAGNGLLSTTAPFSLRGGNGVRFVFNAPNWIVESDALYGLTGIDRATSANTANTVMTRDGNARSQAADPSAAQDVATKNYVDTHTGAASGVSAPTPSTLMARDSAGRSQVVAPSVSADIATKGYVDTATAGLAANTLSVNAQTASYTLALTDAGKFVTVANASACTLTVPPNSSVAFPVGTFIEGAQLGAGQLTLTPGAGVTINAVPGLKLAAQYGAFGLVKLATDTWLAFGRLSA